MRVVKIALLLLLFSGRTLKADSLDIYTCFRSALENGPLAKQGEMIGNREELALKNLNTNYFPELSLSGKATYQSDVFAIPGTTVFPDYPVIPKDQYQFNLNLKQNLYDAGLTRNLKKLETSKSVASLRQLDYDLFGTSEIINQLYFSALLLQENLNTLTLSRETLASQKSSIESKVLNGVLLPSTLYSIEKELLNLDQKILQLQYDHAAAINMLGEWTGLEISEKTQLQVPVFIEIIDTTLNRPEIKLLESQQQVLESSKSLSASKQLPNLYAFAQGGIGSPNPLNFFETDFEPYYSIGLQLNWKPFNWGNVKREKQVLLIQQNEIEAKKEDLIKTIHTGLYREFNDIIKYQELIVMDEQLINLQKKIVEQSFSQLENGIITPADYLAEFNSLTGHKINKQIHQVSVSQINMIILIKTGKTGTN